jgi:hypothetical protein
MSHTTLFFSAFAPRPRPLDDHFILSTVGSEGSRLRSVLAATTPASLSKDQIRTVVDGCIWMLTPEAFRYFLPGFFKAGLENYAELSNFVAELIGALTRPEPGDVQQALERVAQIPTGMGLSPETLEQLRRQQLEWSNSGAPLKTFTERVESLSAAEGAAILAFLVLVRDTHGKDFPFHEPQIAIDRYWARYQTHK